MKMTDEMSKGKPESQSPLQTGFDKKFWDKQKDKPVSKADNTIQYLKRIKNDPWKPVAKAESGEGGNLPRPEKKLGWFSPGNKYRRGTGYDTEALKEKFPDKPVAKGCGMKPGTLRKAMDFINKDLPASQSGRIKLLNDRAKDASANRAKMTMTDEDISEVAQKAVK
jgi:hypothetical protein